MFRQAPSYLSAHLAVWRISVQEIDFGGLEVEKKCSEFVQKAFRSPPPKKALGKDKSNKLSLSEVPF